MVQHNLGSPLHTPHPRQPPENLGKGTAMEKKRSYPTIVAQENVFGLSRTIEKKGKNNITTRWCRQQHHFFLHPHFLDFYDHLIYCKLGKIYPAKIIEVNYGPITPRSDGSLGSRDYKAVDYSNEIK
jgi:hypothetical protein